MLSVEQLLDAGVVLLDEQIDFLHHPEGRLAVAIYGVPDPDCLYIAGPDREATVYQQARDGEPADENGMQAVVLPIVMHAEHDQEDEARIIAEYLDEGPDLFPAVHLRPVHADFMYPWCGDECPITVCCWDLWPITVDQVPSWAPAADNAYWNSRLPQMFELIDNYNGSEFYGERHQEMEEESREIALKLYKLEKAYQGRPDQDELLLELSDRYDCLREEMQKESEAYINRLEQQIVHPVTGFIDAQMPPVDLPPEQAAIWRSLQSLSWRNWSLLENKGIDTGSDALIGSRFVQANRRLCPWY